MNVMEVVKKAERAVDVVISYGKVRHPICLALHAKRLMLAVLQKHGCIYETHACLFTTFLPLACGGFAANCSLGLYSNYYLSGHADDQATAYAWSASLARVDGELEHVTNSYAHRGLGGSAAVPSQH